MNLPFAEKSLDWRRLCRAAAVEQDPEKLSEIVQRINVNLMRRQRMLRRPGKPGLSEVVGINGGQGRAA